MERTLRLKVSMGLQSQVEPRTRVRKEGTWGEHPEANSGEMPAQGGEQCLNMLLRYSPNQEFSLYG